MSADKKEKWTGVAVRRRFLDYFISKGHREVASAGLVPQADPTLLFTNAGMVQFKDVFLGAEKRDYARATSAQKCLRVSGKHNDLEEVGRTARHHTFFEMLGNFSFGDYFKEEAIAYGWEFLTRECGLPVERLSATVFRDDDEAFRIWEKKIGLAPAKIARLGEKDNFWSMGETGPCGPCSEILYDQGPGVGCGKPGCGPGCECDRFLEIWNLVFMQYQRGPDGKLTPLPKPSIDTGMGLERLTAILQGETSNYHTDLLFPIVAAAAGRAGIKYGADPAADISARVIADHLRAIGFLLAEGITFGNEGRNFVLRRLARRALRHGKKLGIAEPFLYQLVPTLVGMMGDHYPELTARQEHLCQSIFREEEKFQRTLASGLNLLEVMIGRIPGGSRQLPGADAFLLHDTYGFPLDLTADILRERGLTVDEAGFAAELEAQRDRSRGAQAGEGEAASVGLDPAIFGSFHGYESLETSSVVKQLVVNGRAAAAAAGEALVVIDPSPFYGEKGGQVGDAGRLHAPGVEVEIHDAKWSGEVLYLIGTVTRGELRTGQTVTAAVDDRRRRAIERNHTATHLLQSALRKIVGDHIRQLGSLVDPRRLRFDFSHYEKLSPEQIRAIEDLVNEAIWQDRPVRKQVLPVEQAKQTGALAFFGDKYGAEVRVVEVEGVSREFCGGTHLTHTGEIGIFRIVSEGSVAAGVRRIEAITAGAVIERFRAVEDEVAAALAELKGGGSTLTARVRALQEQLKQAKEENRRLQAGRGGAAPELAAQAETINGVSLLVAAVPGTAMPDLLKQTDALLKQWPRAVLVLVGKSPGEGKGAPLVVRLAADLAAKAKAGDLLAAVQAPLGASGGGKPDLVRGAAATPEGIDAARAAARAWVTSIS